MREKKGLSEDIKKAWSEASERLLRQIHRRMRVLAKDKKLEKKMEQDIHKALSGTKKKSSKT